MAKEQQNPWVVLKLDDDSEWQGRLPVPVEHYMAGMADEIKRLRAENEQVQEVITKWIEANAAATTLINEQHGKIERLRAAMRDAMENCEVCRWEDTKERRCARCQTFDELLGAKAAPTVAKEPGEAEELRPCPFCGGKVRIATGPAPNEVISLYGKFETFWVVHADKLLSCVASATLAAYYERADAVRTWNTRPLEAALDAAGDSQT